MTLLTISLIDYVLSLFAINNVFSIVFFSYIFVIRVQVEFVDMHFGTGPGSADAFVDLDPYILDEHLNEIEICSRVSKSVFFLVSIELI